MKERDGLEDNEEAVIKMNEMMRTNMSIKADPKRKLIKDKKVQFFAAALIDKIRFHEKLQELHQKTSSDSLQDLQKTA